MKQRKYIFLIFGIFVSMGLVHAINTIRVYIPETQTIGWNSYQAQNITTLSGAVLIDKNNDGALLWDFFSGYYYDDAHGVFSFDELNDKISISGDSTNRCTNNTTHNGYKLEWYSWNGEFWAVNFSQNNNTFVYICVPKDENSNLDSYLWWYAYSELIGFQNFDGIIFDVFVDRDAEHASDARYIKVDGIVSSQNHSNIDSEYENDVRVIWDITKSFFKKQVLQNVYASIRNINSSNGSRTISSLSLWSNNWNNSGWGKLLHNDTVLYFWDLMGQTVSLNGRDNIEWSKTLVVEWWNIYITGNIRNTDDDNAILGLIAIQKDGQGWNIYIHPSVTDIHANIYADRSVISYNGAQLDGNTGDSVLSNQLYIYWSIFSENTLWGADAMPIICPFYISSCDEADAKKYDLNYLRRYILVSEIVDGMPTGNMYPNNNAAESYMWDNSNTNTESQKPWYRIYPFIIEYNADIQQNPPPFF